MDGFLSCFQHGVIMNKAAINIFVQVFLWTRILGFLWGEHAAGNCGGLYVTSEKSPHFFSKWRYHFTIQPTIRGFQLPHTLYKFGSQSFFWQVWSGAFRSLLTLVCVPEYFIVWLFIFLNFTCVDSYCSKLLLVFSPPHYLLVMHPCSCV